MNRLLFTTMFFLCMGIAHPYVDPGTGGMIIGGSIWPLLVGFFLAALGLLIRYFRFIKAGVRKLFKGKK